MNTPSNILVTALFGASLSLTAIAGPGLQYWQNHGASDKSAPVVAAAMTPAAANGLACSTMTVPNRTAREYPKEKTVTCTPEMMKNNPRCQQACGL